MDKTNKNGCGCDSKATDKSKTSTTKKTETGEKRKK